MNHTDFFTGLRHSAVVAGAGARLNAFSATEQTLMAASDAMTRGIPFNGPR